MTHNEGASDSIDNDVDRETLLLQFCINDPRLRDRYGTTRPSALDARTRALTRISALVALGATGSVLRSEIDEAVSAGVCETHVIALLDELVGVLGLPRVVGAAPAIAAVFGRGEDVLPDASS